MISLDDTDGAPLSDRQRLLDLFSAAAACQCDVTLFDRSEPDAPDALGSWASTVGREVRRHEDAGYPYIEVAIGMYAIIVHLRSDGKAG